MNYKQPALMPDHSNSSMLNKTTEEMMDELQHCQRLVNMQERKFRPMRVNYKGQAIKRHASSEHRTAVQCQPRDLFPKMRGQIVTSNKAKPPLDAGHRTGNAFHVAANLAMTNAEQMVNE